MKTNEEINEMVKQMVMAVCHGGFGRLQAMLGAKADKITENSFQFTFKMFRKANLFKIELDEALDLYNCYFIKQRKFTTNDLLKGFSFSDKKFEPVTVMEAKGLFADQVQEFFENTTGLHTCL
ncbi:MAG: hypothetical protein J6U57_07860 [Bacteroidales bacterium]|nr:hypothetical protein [Bacteroidales bacterium]